MEITFLGVLPEYRNLGVGRELVRADLSLMDKLRQSFYGPEVAVALWTSNFSARIGEIFEFETLRFSSYDSVVYNGIRLSDRVDKQHPGIKLSAKKLSTNEKRNES